MKHPPYPLRANKAVDRFMLIEVIRRLERTGDISEYTYYGVGGPYLEDFRLLYEFYPSVGMVSIEEESATYRRQKFHRPCGSAKLKLVHTDLKSFLARYEAKDRKSVFWLDYTRLTYGVFEDFRVLLGKVADRSVIKVTLRAEPSDYWDPDALPEKDRQRREKFVSEFSAILPTPTTEPPDGFEPLAGLLQDMLQISAQQALPSGIGRVVQALSSFCYADGAGMLTFTCMVCPEEHRGAIRGQFRQWRFRNLDWGKPRKIDVPFLRTKERLRLQEFLPCERRAGSVLVKALGYIIDEDRRKSVAKMSQHADFHGYYPYLVRAIP